MSSKSIILDPEYGVNATLTYCPVCGKNADELLLIGKATEYTCPHCDMSHIGQPKNRVCQRCDQRFDTTWLSKKFNGSGRKLSAFSPCKQCAKILNRTNIMICNVCREMFEADAHIVTKAFDSREFTIEQAITNGFLTKTTGKVVRSESCDKCKGRKDGNEKSSC